MILKRTFAIAVFVLFVFMCAPAAKAQAQAPQIPSDIQKIIDKMQQGQLPSPEEQQAISDWAESMSKAYGQGGNPNGEAAAEEKKEELVLTVTMKAQSQASHSYQGTEHPPGIGTTDISSRETDGLALEYTGETRFRVTWGTMDGKEFPFLEKISSRVSFTKKGGGMKQFKETYHSNYGGGSCTNLEEATWIRQMDPVGQRNSRGPDAAFEDKETIVVAPLLGGCENVMDGEAYTRDECSHPNRPSEGHPKVSSIGHLGTKCDELMYAAGDSQDFSKHLRGKVDWNKPTLASGEARYTMDVTDWIEYPERYSPRKSAIPKRGNITLNWLLSREAPDPAEVTVDVAAYENWLPAGNIDDPKEPGKNPLTITATVHKKGDKKTPRQAYLSISLPYISKNRGICGNWPKSVGEEEGLQFREKDFPQSGGILYKDRTHLETDVPVQEVMFRVHSYDFGGWGTLRITARDEAGRDLRVKIRGKDTPDLDIPQDDDANRIGDSWQPEDAQGMPGDWDDETIEGQDATGDGITLYDEYRGLVVLNAQGGREFVRLNPKTMEMFMIDTKNIFPDAKWEEVTGGFKIHRLNDTLVEAGVDPSAGDKANYNDPEHEAHPVLARKVVVRTDDPSENPSPGFKEDHNIYIFPARIQLRIEEDFAWLDTAILKPDSSEGRELRDQGPAMMIQYEDAHNAWALLVDPNMRKVVAAKLQKAILLHEMGHTCGLSVEHGVAKKVNGKTEPDPTPKGQEGLARSCLMFNQADWGRRRTLVFTALGAGDKELAYPYRNFCREVHAPGYQCYRSLKVKEW